MNFFYLNNCTTFCIIRQGIGIKKESILQSMQNAFKCERRDLNPYVEDTRPSNVPVCQFQHARILIK